MFPGRSVAVSQIFSLFISLKLKIAYDTKVGLCGHAEGTWIKKCENKGLIVC